MIGDYPLLSVEAPVAGNVHGIAPGNVPENVPEDVDQRVFEYESCTNLERTPGEPRSDTTPYRTAAYPWKCYVA